jgi:hypothetical protein
MFLLCHRLWKKGTTPTLATTASPFLSKESAHDIFGVAVSVFAQEPLASLTASFMVPGRKILVVTDLDERLVEVGV